ncbi:hypothetical protein APSETT445_003814 [Aspergillus pseudonomiae]
MTAIAQREIATAKAGLRYPLMPEGLFYGPRQYQPSLSKKLSALENYLKVNETIFQAIQKQNTLRHQVSVVPGLVLMDYEPLLNSLLRDVEKEWPSIVGGRKNGGSPSMRFPLQFSDEEIQQQDQDGELWAQGVELMDAFVGDTGCFKHWDGRVSDVDYEKSRRELDEGVKRFLDREARDDEECREWLKVLPFVD